MAERLAVESLHQRAERRDLAAERAPASEESLAGRHRSLGVVLRDQREHVLAGAGGGGRQKKLLMDVLDRHAVASDQLAEPLQRRGDLRACDELGLDDRHERRLPARIARVVEAEPLREAERVSVHLTPGRSVGPRALTEDALESGAGALQSLFGPPEVTLCNPLGPARAIPPVDADFEPGVADGAHRIRSARGDAATREPGVETIGSEIEIERR